MENNTNDEILKVLQELSDGQKKQLALQEEVLEIQRSNFEMVQEQFERARKIQDRAERIQESGTQLMATARKSAAFLIPLVFLLILCVGWLIFRLF